MAPRVGNRDWVAGTKARERAGPEAALFRLLRQGHIFASVVREALQTKVAQEVSSLPLTTSQLHLLKLMALNGQRQLGEVAGWLGVSAPAATKNIDKLERLGLVVRTRSKGDRRATLLSVSSKGRRLVHKYEELKAARLGGVLEEYQPQEIERFTDLLERFSVSLLSTEPSPAKSCLRCAAYLADECAVGRICGGCPYQKVRTARHGENGAEEVS
jgi:DNA-binding MarR family transcriptional regulator